MMQAIVNSGKRLLLAGCALVAVSGVQAAEPARDKVLLIASSYGVAEDNTRPGLEFDEFAMAYQLLSQYPLTIELASPAGGKVESDKYSNEKPYNKTTLADSYAMQLLADSQKLSNVNARDYKAVLVLGGKGAMFDLAEHQPLQQLLQDMLQQQKPVAAVCHGPAALLQVRDAKGNSVLQGRKVAGFSNTEEKMFAKEMIERYPYLLQDAMIAAGADYQQAEPMLPMTVQDGLLITGQNPYSTPAVVEAIVQQLGMPLQARQPYPDEHAVMLIQQLLAGKPVATELDAVATDIPLVAIWGYYYQQFAEHDQQRQQAIDVMELASPYFQDPRFLLALAEGQLQQGNSPRAVALAQAVLKQQPDSQTAQALLDKAEKQGDH